MSFVNGLGGCMLGFLGGMMVLVLVMPEEVVAETVDSAAPVETGEPFVRVAIQR